MALFCSTLSSDEPLILSTIFTPLYMPQTFIAAPLAIVTFLFVLSSEVSSRLPHWALTQLPPAGFLRVPAAPAVVCAAGNSAAVEG